MSDSEFDEILDVSEFKDLVDEPELLSLLAENRQEIAGAVRSLVDRCLEDGEFQGRPADTIQPVRSAERRVGEERRSRSAPDH